MNAVSPAPALSRETTTALHLVRHVRRTRARAAVVMVWTSGTTAARNARGTQATRFRRLCTRHR